MLFRNEKSVIQVGPHIPLQYHDAHGQQIFPTTDSSHTASQIRVLVVYIAA
jgi:hypothetical protein